jgi:hypothetical protein
MRTGEIVLIFVLLFIFSFLLLLPGVVEGGQSFTLLRGMTGP